MIHAYEMLDRLQLQLRQRAVTHYILGVFFLLNICLREQ